LFVIVYQLPKDEKPSWHHTDWTGYWVVSYRRTEFKLIRLKRLAVAVYQLH